MAAPIRKHGTVLQRLYVALSQAWRLENRVPMATVHTQSRMATAVHTQSRMTTGIVHTQTRNASGKAKTKAKQKKKEFKTPEMEYIKSELLSKHIGTVPSDNVWFVDQYPEPCFTFEEAIHRHQLMAQPAIYDSMDSYVYVKMTVNTWTHRENVYVTMSKSTLVPHSFQTPMTPRCAVVTKTKENAALARKCGALYAGGSDLLAQIQTDQVSLMELDHILVTPDMTKSVIAMKAMFEDMFPSSKNGSISEDIPGMLTKFLNGIMLKFEDTETTGLSTITFPIGTLNMPTEQLSENLKELEEKIHISRPQKTKVGKFILEVEVNVPGSPFHYKLDPELHDKKETKKKKSMD